MKHMTHHEARSHVNRLITIHGLSGWSCKIDTARTRAGICNPVRKVIGMSRYLLAQRSYEDSYNTITHEIAHAIVGAHHKHDAVWRAKHIELGGDGKRCFQHEDKNAPWVGVCAHGKQYQRYRAPAPNAKYHCRCCRGGTLVVWERKR